MCAVAADMTELQRKKLFDGRPKTNDMVVVDTWRAIEQSDRLVDGGKGAGLVNAYDIIKH
jgi:hypothetical protein